MFASKVYSKWSLLVLAAIGVSLVMAVVLVSRAGAHVDSGSSGGAVHICVDTGLQNTGSGFAIAPGLDCADNTDDKRHLLTTMIIGGADDSDRDPVSNTFIPLRFSAARTSFHDVSQVFPSAGSVSNFHVVVNLPPGLGVGWTFTVWKATSRTDLTGAATSVTCTIQGDQTSNAQCSDTANSAAYDAGDFIAINVSPIGQPPAREARWTAAYGLDTSP